MNTSSFLCGVLLGAAASMMMSRKRNLLMSSFGQSNGGSGSATDRAKDKIMGMAMTGFGSQVASDADGKTLQGSDHHAEKQESPLKSKESNLKMLKDFIRSNPDVKHEVEQILKDTHTTIPGL